MKDETRRRFLKSAGALAVASSFPSSSPARAATTDAASPSKTERTHTPLDLGIASYTFRAFSLDQTIAMTKRIGLRKLTLKDVHLPLTSTDQEIQAALDKINNAGLELDSCGVIYMKSEQEITQAFAYAKKIGVKKIIGSPEPQVLAVVERFVKETGVAVAIHNHGPSDKNYPSPESVYHAVANMDKRMGLCIDVGHTQRLGLEPTAQFVRCFDRVLDIHLKDVSSARPDADDTEIGRGVIDIPTFLKEATQRRYSGTLHFEFEKDQSDPLPGLAESVGYVRGILTTI